MSLGKKQGLPDSGPWLDAIRRARTEWDDARLDNLIDKTVDEIRRTIRRTPGKRAGYAWSGGKDSLVLQVVAEAAGVEECALGISELEFPAMLQWITDNMPPGLRVISTGQDLAWLAKHPLMLFPQGAYGPRWFQIINHRAQDTFYRDARLDVLLTGRRRADGNYIAPKAGTNVYTNGKGVTRYSPIAWWSHEACFALIEREGFELPPCYGWPRGYQIGTGSWPARQWTRDVDHGFEEVWEIDPDVVRDAAPVIAQARDWMERTGRS